MYVWMYWVVAEGHWRQSIPNIVAQASNDGSSQLDGAAHPRTGRQAGRHARTHKQAGTSTIVAHARTHRPRKAHTHGQARSGTHAQARTLRHARSGTHAQAHSGMQTHDQARTYKHKHKHNQARTHARTQYRPHDDKTHVLVQFAVSVCAARIPQRPRQRRGNSHEAVGCAEQHFPLQIVCQVTELGDLRVDAWPPLLSDGSGVTCACVRAW